MPRAKKDGQHINCYIDRTLCERLKAYADEKGQTMTMALERILKQYFESENKEAMDRDSLLHNGKTVRGFRWTNPIEETHP